jgi:hypothetical protein
MAMVVNAPACSGSAIYLNGGKIILNVSANIVFIGGRDHNVNRAWPPPITLNELIIPTNKRLDSYVAMQVLGGNHCLW